MAQKKRSTLTSTGTISVNRRAKFDYEIEEEVEAGLQLLGTEVKSLRRGTVNLSDAYAGPKDGEMYLFNVHIGDYPNAPAKFQHEPKRARKLLLHKRERDKFLGAAKQGGYTLVPLRLYFNNRGICKLALGLGKGKRQVDKRETIKQRDWQRKKAQVMKEYG
ncbi:SsrA-binding protein SmpB [Marivibrio halodurans]|uniref:SsrA-binding protein n=1 Tax=Marivibrio halodurans TaxID=2039722 RepID=A0A8J7S5D3_9PROT|nr:SsrA-binding protein SmpB [Marivibrio halodurans]MBP5855877.1 SsrA-binding protein SmpB [Marivibrio halodurans]